MSIKELTSTSTKRDHFTAAFLVASELVSSQAMASAVKTCASHVETVLAQADKPDGTDCRNMKRIFSSAQSLAIIMAAMNWTPKELARNVFSFRSVYQPERAPNEYLALKSMVKLEALSVAMVLGDGTAYPNSNKYLITVPVLSEALSESEVANGDVYDIYTGNQTRINAILDSIPDADHRALLKDRELWKSQSTASTQRPSSAWLLHFLGCGSNNGNQRTITVDRSHENYQMLLKLFNLI